MDPFRNLLNLTDDKRQYIIDSDRVSQEEFEAAAVLSDVLWGQEGLAEMLGSTWRMVHDPRFLAVERCGIREQPNVFQDGTSKIGVQVLRCGDVFGDTGSLDDMTIYAEILGEGRHFLKIVTKRGWDPAALTEDQIWSLISSECSNYQHRNGTWNRAAHRLAELFRAGLIGLVRDYADVAYCTDWVRMDTQEVVHPGQRVVVTENDGVEVEDDVPVIAVEVDNLFRALTMRAQVRMVAYKMLKQFPGIKADDLESLQLTDGESDEICQKLFSVKWDKVYTIIPRLADLVNKAKAIPYEQRQADESSALRAASQEFNDKLKSGEIEAISTPVEKAAEDDTTGFMFKLSRNPYYAALFRNLQILEARGVEGAKELSEELLRVQGAGDIWERILQFEEKEEAAFAQDPAGAAAAAVLGTQWNDQTPVTAATPTLTVADGVFDGTLDSTFKFVYVNEVPDPRGYHTAIVDVMQKDEDVRKTWSISPLHMRQIHESLPEGQKLAGSTWNRRTDHERDETTFTFIS